MFILTQSHEIFRDFLMKAEIYIDKPDICLRFRSDKIINANCLASLILQEFDCKSMNHDSKTCCSIR